MGSDWSPILASECAPVVLQTMTLSIFLINLNPIETQGILVKRIVQNLWNTVYWSGRADDQVREKDAEQGDERNSSKNRFYPN